MFCTKCGNEIKDNQMFCTKCGARKEITPIINEALDMTSTPSQMSTTQKPLNLNYGGNYIISIFLIVLCGILFLTKTFSLDMLMKAKMSIFEIFEVLELLDLSEVEFLKPIITIIYIISVIILVLPVIRGKQITKTLNIFALVTSLLIFILFVGILILIAVEANEYGADFGCTFSGFLLICGNILSIILLFKDLINYRK